MILPILILTIDPDPHADFVERILKRRKRRVIRLNTNQISEFSQISFNTSGSMPTIGVRSDGKLYTPKDFQSIWFRKPFLQLQETSQIGVDKALEINFKFEEYRNACTAFLFEAKKNNVFVLSHYDNIVKANYKLLQLIAASKIGFHIPETLVSSDVKEIKSFIDSYDKTVIMKTLGKPFVEVGNKKKIFYTYMLTAKQFSDYYKDKVIDFPLLVQEEIKKKIELRITVVGNRIFACAIDSQSLAHSKVDWRMADPYKLKHEMINLPSEVERCCFEICRSFGLQFSAIDMAITPKGDYVFFEINPNGQYLWIEDITKAPISSALADLLADPKQYIIS